MVFQEGFNDFLKTKRFERAHFDGFFEIKGGLLA